MSRPGTLAIGNLAGVSIAEFVLPQRPSAGINAARDRGRPGPAVARPAGCAVAALPQLNRFHFEVHKTPRLKKFVLEPDGRGSIPKYRRTGKACVAGWIGYNGRPISTSWVSLIGCWPTANRSRGGRMVQG